MIIAFSATFILEFAGIAMYGSGMLSSRIVQVAMLIPALTAIFCLVWFKSATLTREAKLFLALFVITAGTLIFELVFFPILGTVGYYPILFVATSFGSLVLVFVLNLKGTWRENLVAAKLAFGKNRWLYLVLSIIFSSIFIIGYLLSYFL